jgi:hypothetical protein
MTPYCILYPYVPHVFRDVLYMGSYFHLIFLRDMPKDGFFSKGLSIFQYTKSIFSVYG